MIKVYISQKEGDISIDVVGHAEYDEYGKDIVCAGVSAIVQTAILGLEAIAQSYPNNVQIINLGGEEKYDL